MEAKTLNLEVVYARADAQTVLTVAAAAGDSVALVIARSGIVDRHPELRAGPLQAGIFGRRVSMATPVAEGDRVEIYRPLTLSPTAARRRRAQIKKAAESPA